MYTSIYLEIDLPLSILMFLHVLGLVHSTSKNFMHLLFFVNQHIFESDSLLQVNLNNRQINLFTMEYAFESVSLCKKHGMQNRPL